MEGGDGAGALVSFLMSAAAVGFLLQNCPPAKIFMGDVGSIPIGFLVSVLALRSSVKGTLDIGASCLVFAPFILDATIALVRRALAGERVWEAHRGHWYQRLVLAGWGHRRTLLLELAFMLLSGVAGLAWAGASDECRIAILLGVAAIAAAVHAVARNAARARPPGGSLP